MNRISNGQAGGQPQTDRGANGRPSQVANGPNGGRLGGFGLMSQDVQGEKDTCCEGHENPLQAPDAGLEDAAQNIPVVDSGAVLGLMRDAPSPLSSIHQLVFKGSLPQPKELMGNVLDRQPAPRNLRDLLREDAASPSHSLRDLMGEASMRQPIGNSGEATPLQPNPPSFLVDGGIHNPFALPKKERKEPEEAPPPDSEDDAVVVDERFVGPETRVDSGALMPSDKRDDVNGSPAAPNRDGRNATNDK